MQNAIFPLWSDWLALADTPSSIRYSFITQHNTAIVTTSSTTITQQPHRLFTIYFSSTGSSRHWDVMGCFFSAHVDATSTAAQRPAPQPSRYHANKHHTSPDVTQPTQPLATARSPLKSSLTSPTTATTTAHTDSAAATAASHSPTLPSSAPPTARVRPVIRKALVTLNIDVEPTTAPSESADVSVFARQMAHYKQTLRPAPYSRSTITSLSLSEHNSSASLDDPSTSDSPRSKLNVVVVQTQNTPLTTANAAAPAPPLYMLPRPETSPPSISTSFTHAAPTIEV